MHCVPSTDCHGSVVLLPTQTYLPLLSPSARRLFGPLPQVDPLFLGPCHAVYRTPLSTAICLPFLHSNATCLQFLLSSTACLQFPSPVLLIAIFPLSTRVLAVRPWTLSARPVPVSTVTCLLFVIVLLIPAATCFKSSASFHCHLFTFCDTCCHVLNVSCVLCHMCTCVPFLIN